MQVVEGGDGCGEVALCMVQLLYVSGNLFDLPGAARRNRNKVEEWGAISEDTT